MDKRMGQKEVKRAQVLDRLNEGKISQPQASKQVGITPRQVRRLANRYQQKGVAGLVSKRCGSASNRRLDETLRATAIELIGTHYPASGSLLARHTLAATARLTISGRGRTLLLGANIGQGNYFPG